MSFFLVSLLAALVVGTLRFWALAPRRDRPQPRALAAAKAPARPTGRRVVSHEAA